MKKILIICFAFICYSHLSAGQENDSSAVAKLYADFSIPDVSAFTLLGVNPSKITKPSSPKDISADVINVGKSGNNIPAGLAIEWAPWMTWGSQKLNDSTSIYKDWKEFKKSRWKRELSFSFGTLQDSTGSKVALGASWCIYDKSDPSYDMDYVMKIAFATKSKLTPLETMTNLKNEYLTKRAEVFKYLNIDSKSPLIDNTAFKNTDALPEKEALVQKVRDAMGPNNRVTASDLRKINELVELYISAVKDYRAYSDKDEKAFAQIIADAKKEFKKSHWNAGILKIGAGNIWNSTDNTWKQLQSQKFSSFLAWSLKFGTWGQGILLGQYKYTYNDSSYHVNQYTFGGRIVAGSNNIHGSIEGVYENNAFSAIGSMPNKSNKNNLRSTLGIELRMNDGLWIELATGITGPSEDFWKNAGMLGLGSIKYCFIKESRYKNR